MKRSIKKNRHKYITKAMLEDLERIFKRLLNNQDCVLIEFNGEADYMHVLFESPPQVKLSKLINTLKTISSRFIKKNLSLMLKIFT